MDRTPDGNDAVSSLNYFLLLTYYRLMREAKDTAANQAPSYHPHASAAASAASFAS